MSLQNDEDISGVQSTWSLSRPNQPTRKISKLEIIRKKKRKKIREIRKATEIKAQFRSKREGIHKSDRCVKNYTGD